MRLRDEFELISWAVWEPRTMAATAVVFLTNANVCRKDYKYNEDIMLESFVLEETKNW